MRDRQRQKDTEISGVDEERTPPTPGAIAKPLNGPCRPKIQRREIIAWSLNPLTLSFSETKERKLPALPSYPCLALKVFLSSFSSSFSSSSSVSFIRIKFQLSSIQNQRTYNYTMYMFVYAMVCTYQLYLCINTSP